MSIIIKHSIASGLVLLLCATFFIESLNYPDTAARLPQILIIILALLAITMLIESVIKQKKAPAEETAAVEEDGKIMKQRVIIFGVMIALYIVLLETVGYFILTPIFTFAALTYLKATKLITALVISIGFTGIIYALFSVFLNVPIPLGLFS